MNVPRYVIAGGASLVIHAALLFVAQESKVFAMPAGSQSNTVSINFTPKSTPSQAQQKTVTEPVEPEPIKEPVSKAEPKPAEPEGANGVTGTQDVILYDTNDGPTDMGYK